MRIKDCKIECIVRVIIPGLVNVWCSRDVNALNAKIDEVIEMISEATNVTTNTYELRCTRFTYNCLPSMSEMHLKRVEFVHCLEDVVVRGVRVRKAVEHQRVEGHAPRGRRGMERVIGPGSIILCRIRAIRILIDIVCIIFLCPGCALHC